MLSSKLRINTIINKGMASMRSANDKPRVRTRQVGGFTITQEILNPLRLKTICEEGSCPNLPTCWSQKHAAFMILGDVCTRACSFCHVKTGRPTGVDASEPQRLAAAVSALRLSHVVVTSVNRDDLGDGGASHFVRVIEAIREKCPLTTIEILTPDFMNKPEAVKKVIAAKPDVYNHNVETVPRLYPSIRPGARYFNSLNLLRQAAEANLYTKSGLMVGLGESSSEVFQVMDDLRSAGVDFLTVGQYLQPTPQHASVQAYISDEMFKDYETMAWAKGFLMVSASPLTRSSYHAGDDFQRLRDAHPRQSLNQRSPLLINAVVGE